MDPYDCFVLNTSGIVSMLAPCGEPISPTRDAPVLAFGADRIGGSLERQTIDLTLKPDDIGGFGFGWGGSVVPRADAKEGEAVSSLVEVPRSSVSHGKAGGAADLRGPARHKATCANDSGKNDDPKMSSRYRF